MSALLFNYKYKVMAFEVTFDGKKMFPIEPKFISGITIDKDFDKNVFPLIAIDVGFDTLMYNNIIANKENVRYRLKLRKIVYEGEKLKSQKEVMNDMFVSFLDGDMPFVNKDMYNASVNVNGPTPTDKASKKIRLYLFKEDDVLKTKKIINLIISSGNMTDALGYLFSVSGIKKVLMSPLDNNKSFSQAIIPPYTLLGNIKYLHKQFGFYKTGAALFFDTDITYLLKKSKRATAWRRGEYTKVVFEVPRMVSENNARSGCITNTDDKLYKMFITAENMSMRAPSFLQDPLEGNHRLVINSSIDKTFNMKSDLDQRGDGTYKVVLNQYSSDYANSAEMSDLQSSAKVIQFAHNDGDINIFTPNKEYLLAFEDRAIQKKYGDYYRLSRVIMTLKGQGDNMAMTAAITLRA